MRNVFVFLLVIMFTQPALADQGLIAKKPYYEQIYRPSKKRKLYFAVDKLQLTTLESILTKTWRERVNPNVLKKLDSEFIIGKMEEYDSRVREIKRHFDIEFVDWYHQGITYKPAYRVGKRSWERLPEGDYESHRWLQFMEWFVHEWNYPDAHESWERIRQDIRNDTYEQRREDRRDFVEQIIAKNPEKYERIEWDCYYDLNEIGECGYYWLHDKEKDSGVQIYELGYEDIPMPTIPQEPQIQLCPLDNKFIINKK